MSEARLGRRIAALGAFAGLCAAALFARLLPLGTGAGGLPPPDLIAALVIAWSVRRPDLLPLWAVAVAGLAADMLLMRPPGLWAALLVVASEALRRRHGRLQTLPLTTEIALAAGLLALMVVLHWLALALLLVPQPSLWAQLVQVPVTAAAYPLVALLCRVGLGLRRRPAPEGLARGLGA